ncbi:hypothetical protein DV738_g1346, partial [Chaetothyriales sp. CBS 135597]
MGKRKRSKKHSDSDSQAPPQSFDVKSNVLPEGIHHYQTIEEVPEAIQKYWQQGYSIFSRYDEGIWMTDTAWYGVTHESVADKIAQHVFAAKPADRSVICDIMCGAGGNAIAFAKSGKWKRVYAIERDPATLQCARHNAEIYGVAHLITFFEGDCFEILGDGEGKVEVLKQVLDRFGLIFASPPWGGPGYHVDDVFNLDTMLPYNIADFFTRLSRFSRYLVLYLPRNSNLEQIARYVDDEDKAQVIHYYGGTANSHATTMAHPYQEADDLDDLFEDGGDFGDDFGNELLQEMANGEAATPAVDAAATPGDISMIQGETDANELGAFLAEGGTGGQEANDFLNSLENRELESGEKAADAQDFGDISDDDLPDEEIPTGESTQDLPPLTNVAEPSMDDELNFGGGDLDDDLFGGPLSPPATTDNAFEPAPTQPPTALTNGDQRAESPDLASEHSADSPGGSSDQDDEDDEVDEKSMALWRLQQMLLGTGDEPMPETEEENMAEWVRLEFPQYNRDEAPFWNQLLPPKPGVFHDRDAKYPTKPPKPIRPTKVTLDIEKDQQALFNSAATSTVHEVQRGLVRSEPLQTVQEYEESSDESDLDEPLPGGITMQELEFLCTDFDSLSALAVSDADLDDLHARAGLDAEMLGIDTLDFEHPRKKQKTGRSAHDIVSVHQIELPSFSNPERITSKLARKVILDLNDSELLLEEIDPESIRAKLRAGNQATGSSTMKSKLSAKFRQSNDAEYDLLKQNHQHKVRGQLSHLNIEHSMPAIRLQYPYYKVKPDVPELRNFHRTKMLFKNPITFSKPAKHKRKHFKGKAAKEIYAETKDLSLGDNSSVVLLEYSEEHPIILSQPGMGSKIVNYYRKKGNDDTTRPKHDLGETQVLLPEDKSPFYNIGHVDPGEEATALYNSLYRAPLFEHDVKPQDFIVIREKTGLGGDHFFVRKADNIFVVGQELPSAQVPGTHSRMVTTASKNRLKAISYRIARRKKSHRIKVEDVTRHFPDTTDMQNRQKMKEFMQFSKEFKEWEMRNGEDVPDEEHIQSLIKPEDQAIQEKAHLRLYGDGDPSGRGEAISFLKISMKGGFKAQGGPMFTEDQKKKDFGGHSYNVAMQQKLYEDSKRRVWDKQKEALSSKTEPTDMDEEGDVDTREEARARGGVRATHTGFSTPSGRRRDDETGTSFSKRSVASQTQRYLKIKRTFLEKDGSKRDEIHIVTDPAVIKAYQRQRGQSDNELEQAIAEREARKASAPKRRKKTKNDATAGSPEGGEAASPNGDAGSPAPGGREQKATQRKCANCGQVGHIKTNKKLCPLLNGSIKQEDAFNNAAFMALQPMAVYALRVDPTEDLVAALPNIGTDLPMFRITMAAIDPSEDPDSAKKAKLNALLEALQADEDEDMDDADEEDDDDDEDKAKALASLAALTKKAKGKGKEKAINDEHVFFRVVGSHPIYLTGNYVIPNELTGASEYDSEDDEDEYDYDLSPDDDELDGLDALVNGDSESDDLDDLDDPRVQELDGDEDDEAPQLTESKKQAKAAAKGKNKRPAADVSDDDEAEPALDDIVAKSLKKDAAASANKDKAGEAAADESKLSKAEKRKQKKLKKNDGTAVETATSETTKAKEGAASGEKKVQFDKNLVKGPSSNGDGKPAAGAATKSVSVREVNGVTVDDRKIGNGPAAKKGSKLEMRYIGKLESTSAVFDSNKSGKPFSFKLGAGEVIKGWDIGLEGIKPGGERRIIVPANLAYGKKSLPGIPANSKLIFDVKSGAITIDALVREGVFEKIRVFERREKPGGCWLPDPEGHVQQLPDLQKLANRTADEPVEVPDTLPALTPRCTQYRFSDTSIYPLLETNIAAAAMEYSAEPIPDTRSEWSIQRHGPDTPFRHHSVIQQWLEDLVNRNGYQDLVEYNTTVERVRKNSGDGKWEVVLRKPADDQQDYWWKEEFDAVIDASGHYNVPYIPPTPGLVDFANAYPGSVEHTKSFRGVEKYRGKRVIIVGASISGPDLAAALAGITASPLHCVTRGKYHPYFGDWAFRNPYILRHGPITHIDTPTRTVHFDDGTTVSDVDYIIFGTGYSWTEHFLPQIQVRNNRVPGLYQHIFFRDDPSLVFVGAIAAGFTFKVFEWQAVLAARFLAGRVKLPPLEEQEQWERDRLEEKGDGVPFTALYPHFEQYFEQIRLLAGDPAPEGQPGANGRRLPVFDSTWRDQFDAAHLKRIAMWQRLNAAAEKELAERASGHEKNSTAVRKRIESHEFHDEEGEEYHGSNDLHRLIVSHGGGFLQYLDGKTAVTHLIASHLTPKKKVEFARYRIVKPAWVVDSVNAGRLLPWDAYRLVDEGVTQKVLGFREDGSIASQVNHSQRLQQQQGYRSQTSQLKGGHEPDEDAELIKQRPPEPPSKSETVTVTDPEQPEEKRQLTAEEHNAILLSNPHLAKSSSANPDFINQYYRERAAGSRRYILHVDFDSFFAAVSLRKHPHLVDKPVVIAHGSGPSSEIASCNYPARNFGIKNGMWMKTALERCPELKVLPYDFKLYEEASRHFYESILAMDGIVQSISIDEALIDVSDQCIRAGGSDGRVVSEGSIYREEEKAQQIALELRQSVRDKTGCEVSVGIGANILLAKTALRKAKPAGQCLVKPEQVLGFLGELVVTDLPGIAWSIGKKLEEIGVRYVKDIRGLTKERLMNHLGPKTGEKIWDYSRGIDRQEVGEQVVRKSVSAEINWGIRFINQQQAEEFVQSLCNELSKRLLEQLVKGRQLTMKIMRKAADAAMDPPKSLGHGKCDTFNKSVVLGLATTDPAIIGKEAISILRGYAFPPGELRGLGVQMQKLEPLKTAAAGASSIQAPIESSQRRLQFKKPTGAHRPSRPKLTDRTDLLDEIQSPEKKREGEQIKGAIRDSDAADGLSSTKKPLNITGTQFLLSTQFDPDVLAELPADIRSKLVPRQKTILDSLVKPTSPKPAANSRPASPQASLSHYIPPNQSQLDSETLAELPEDVRNEVLAHYQAQNKKPRSIQQPKKLPITPSKKERFSTLATKSRSRTSSSNTSTLTQSNFVSMAKVVSSHADAEPMLDEEISQSFLDEMPEDIKLEILAQQKRQRMKAKSGLNLGQSKRKARPLAGGGLNPPQGQQKLKLPPREPKPTFTSQKLSTLPQLRDAMTAWVREFSEQDGEGPYEEDVAALATYLERVILEERNMDKAVSLVKWLQHVVDMQSFQSLRRSNDSGSAGRSGLSIVKETCKKVTSSIITTIRSKADRSVGSSASSKCMIEAPRAARPSDSDTATVITSPPVRPILKGDSDYADLASARSDPITSRRELLPTGARVKDGLAQSSPHLKTSQSIPSLQTKICQKLYIHPTVIRRSQLSRPSVYSLSEKEQPRWSVTPYSSSQSTHNSDSCFSPNTVQTGLLYTPPTSDITPSSCSTPYPEGVTFVTGSQDNSLGLSHDVLTQPILPPIPERDLPLRISILTAEAAATAKAFFETYFNTLVCGPNPRERRRWILERRLHQLQLPRQLEYRACQVWAMHESNNLRQYRRMKTTFLSPGTNQSIAVREYEVLKILGKGSFGVVRLVREKDKALLTRRTSSMLNLVKGATRSSLRTTTEDGSLSFPANLDKTKKEVYAMKVIRKSDMLRNSQEGHLRAERDFLVSAEGSQWIIPLLAAFQDDSFLYLVMDFCIGGDFLGLLIRKNVLSEEITRWYVAEMVLCVEEAHRMRWIHRDVKPDNFLVGADGHLKISDFGLAFDGQWDHDQKFYHKQRHDLIDKLEIEVAGDEQDVTEDQEVENASRWSIGIIMYECLYGFTPFACEDRRSTKLKIMKHKDTLRFPSIEPPHQPSVEAIDLMKQLLVEKEKRLSSRNYRLNDCVGKPRSGKAVRFTMEKSHRYQGQFVYPDDAEDLKAHPFFRNINWAGVLTRRPPFVPRVQSWEDTKYFDDDTPCSDVESASSDADGTDDVLESETVAPIPSDVGGVEDANCLEFETTSSTTKTSQHHHEVQHIIPSAALNLNGAGPTAGDSRSPSADKAAPA